MLASLSIRALEKNGWLIRKTHPNDTRAKSLHLTAKTHQHLKRNSNHLNEAIVVFTIIF